MLQPLVRRTWAPRGQTPVMYCWDRHDRLSVIAALTLSARRRRIGLYWTIHPRNLTADEVEAFLRDLQRHLGRRLVVVMDRWAAHRKAAKALANDPRFQVEWLPAYAPDLNPVEQLWSHTKYSDLANYAPQDTFDLRLEAEAAIEKTSRCDGLMRSFFHGAKLRV